MKLNDIRLIANSYLSDSEKETAILQILSKDKNVIPYMLKLLESEREETKELLSDTNMELSRAAAVLKDPKLSEHSWVLEQIKLHYEKWKDVIKCNFNL